MVTEAAGPDSDFLLRGVLRDQVRFIMTDCTRTVERGVLVHDADPAAAYFFGRGLIVAVLLTALLKNREKFSVRWEYAGELGSILVDADAEGRVRGIPRKPHLAEKGFAEADLYGGSGTVTILRFDHEGRVLSSGSTRAGLLDIVEDTALHLSVSDQVETAIVAAMDFRSEPLAPIRLAAGMMIQAMPGCDLEVFSALRTRLHTTEFTDVLKQPGRGREKEKLFRALSVLQGGVRSEDRDGSGEGVPFSRASLPSYCCLCSSGRMREMVLTIMDPDDLARLLDEQGGARIQCHFCNTRYSFSRQDLNVPSGLS